jgi:hypothetical protein
MVLMRPLESTNTHPICHSDVHRWGLAGSGVGRSGARGAGRGRGPSGGRAAGGRLWGIGSGKGESGCFGPCSLGGRGGPVAVVAGQGTVVTCMAWQVWLSNN